VVNIGSEVLQIDSIDKISRPSLGYAFPFDRFEEGIPSELKWFEENRFEALAPYHITDDLRFTRFLVARMIYEDSLKEEFLHNNPGATDDDRIMMIQWNAAFACHTGVLSIDEVTDLIVSAKTGEEFEVARFVPAPINEDVSFCEISSVIGRVRRFREANPSAVIGMFHGSFDAPVWKHLSLIREYRQFCDLLIVGVDNDELVRNLKGASRVPDRIYYPIHKRVGVFKAFPHIVDDILVMPMRQPNPHDYIKLYEILGINRVFMSDSDPKLSERVAQTLRAGAVPVIDEYEMNRYTSSLLATRLAYGQVNCDL